MSDAGENPAGPTPPVPPTQPYPGGPAYGAPGQPASPRYPGQAGYLGYGPYPGYPGYPWGAPPPEDPGAMPAMIVGIVSLALGFLACGVGLLGSPVALVMGLRSKRRIDASGGALRGRGNAQTGFVLGLIGTILLVLALLAVLLVIALIVTNAPEISHGYDGTSV